ncbi:MAG: SagB/ThcOx family dehydrogenase [Pseudomonadota bacterium]
MNAKVSIFSEIEQHITDRQSYRIEQQRQDDMETFHERTKFFPSTILNKSIKVGNYMNYRPYVSQMVSNFKSYPLSSRIELPEPNQIAMSFSEIQNSRCSTRQYSAEPISLQMLSDLLAASAGVNRLEHHPKFPDLEIRKRVYPSAGNLFPVEIYPVILRGEGLSPCVTHYDAIKHRLDIIEDDVTKEKVANAMADFEITGTGYTRDISLIIVLTAVFQRSVTKYEERGYRFAMLEAGLLGNNFSLAATGLGMRSLNWGAYYDGLTDELLRVDGVNESVVNCIMIGKPVRP